MNYHYSVLLSDKFGHGCNLLLGLQMSNSATAGTAFAYNPVFPAKMTKLLNKVVSGSVCLFLGGEKRGTFSKTLWLDLHLNQTAVQLEPNVLSCQVC